MDEIITFTPPPDLCQAAVRYQRLLRKVHLRHRKVCAQDDTQGISDKIGNRNSNFEKMDSSLQNAIYRYEILWLPLLATAGKCNEKLVPPWDVYYVWCLHMLTSGVYREYCCTKFGRTLDHTFLYDVTEENRACTRARQLWEERYTENFDVDSDLETVSKPTTKLAAIIWDSERKHNTFYQQVSLSHFMDRHFLEGALDRYKKLVSLQRKFPSADLCPSVDVELMRQAHVLHPVCYERDLSDLVGSVHQLLKIERTFDSVDSNVSELAVAMETTSRMWSTTFSTTYDIAGVKQRLTPLETAQRYIVCASGGHLRQMEPVSATIVLNNIKIADLWSRDQRIVVEVRRLGRTAYSSETLYRVGGKSGEAISTESAPGHARTTFNFRENRGFELHTFGSRGRGCFRAEDHVASTFFDPRQVFAEGDKWESCEREVQLPRISYGDPNVSFTCLVELVETAKHHSFSLHREAFVLSSLPSDLKPFIQLASWSDADVLDLDKFSVATHSLHNPDGNCNFTCQVVSCRDLDLGAVLLYENGSDLIVVAQTVGEDLLPHPEQVSPGFKMSLDKLSGQHAMLIQNNEGDWGLCILKHHPEKEDSVVIAFENLRRHYVTEVPFIFESKSLLTIDQMSVDLYTGRVTLKSGCVEVAEYVALAYVIGVLYVFITGRHLPELSKGNSRIPQDASVSVSPPPVVGTTAAKIRAKSRYDVTSKRTSNRMSSAVTSTSLKSRRKKHSLVCTMLLACGLQAHMMVDEDLPQTSYHSTVSLHSGDNDYGEDDNFALHGFDAVHRQHFYQEVRENARKLNAKTQSGLITSTSHDQFAFQKADNSFPQNSYAFQVPISYCSTEREEVTSPSGRTSVTLRPSGDMYAVPKCIQPRDTYHSLPDDPIYDTADVTLTPADLEMHARAIVSNVIETAVTQMIGNGKSDVHVHQTVKHYPGTDMPDDCRFSATFEEVTPGGQEGTMNVREEEDVQVFDTRL